MVVLSYNNTLALFQRPYAITCTYKFVRTYVRYNQSKVIPATVFWGLSIRGVTITILLSSALAMCDVYIRTSTESWALKSIVSTSIIENKNGLLLSCGLFVIDVINN